MKRNINLGQLNKLSIREEKLLSYLYNYILKTKQKELQPYFIDIAFMIELLINEENFNLDYSSLDKTWGVRIGEKEFGSKELCDALWSACRNILQEDK